MNTMHDAPNVGLVLSGGGARGAYEVGVLRYLRERIPFATPFNVITGTSVGAINGAYIAATCDRPRAQARMLQRVWMEMTIDSVYGMSWRQLRKLPTILFGQDLPKTPHGGRVGGLVDTSALEALVRKRIPWRGITENIHRGHLGAFACTATEMATGISTVFMQNAAGARGRWPHGPNEMIVPTSITAAHTLASAAIPLLFPAIRVGDQFYLDGALRQNTPLRPAMRLGANRLLVVGLSRHETTQVRRQRQRMRAEYSYPNTFFLLGKMLNALMLDKVETDLQRIEQTNILIDAGEAEFGLDFGTRLASAMNRPPYRKIQTCMIHPSEDLGKIAWELVRSGRLDRYTGFFAKLIRRSVASDNNFEDGESDLASYMLFDGEYIRRCIDLGYADAEARRVELMQLFDR